MEREFTEMRRRIETDKEVELDKSVKLPPKSDSFRKTLRRWNKGLRSQWRSLGSSKYDIVKIDSLFSKQLLQREIRDRILHDGVTVKRYIHKAWRENNEYHDPQEYGVDLPIRDSRKPPKPYHWRVAYDLHRSSWDMREVLIAFRKRYLKEKKT